MQRLAFIVVLLVNVSLANAQILPYKNPALPVETRVKDLLSRMTPEEKFWQCFMIPGDLDGVPADQYKNGIFGFQVSAGSKSGGNSEQMLHYNTSEEGVAVAKKINAIQKYFVENTRLGIPIIAFDEALHGLVRKGATAFPQSIAMAATFDTALVGRAQRAVADETNQRGIRQILSPVINIASDVRWGRTEETYGEDPFLSSMMGLAFVQAFEQKGIITTPKHFLANVGDGGRDSYPIDMNERLLKEIQLPPFKTAFMQGNALSVMTSYNSINGSPATANDWLLQQLLKKEYGFKGFVISDAGAVGGANVLHFTASDYADASKKAMQNGLDVIFQTAYEHYKLFIPPFLDGSISGERIDDAVGRVLAAKFSLGLFEHPYINIDSTTDVKSHRQLSKEVAAKSFVLLQNNDNNLPLGNPIKTIAVIGEEAVAGRLGGYSGPGNNVVNMLNGIKQTAAKNMQVNYARGAGRNDDVFQPVPATVLYTDAPCTQQGLNAVYFKNVTATGNPFAKRTDAQVNNSWTLYGPDALQINRFYSVEWNGYVKAGINTNYQLAIEGNDGYRLYINDSLVANRWSKQSYHRDILAKPLIPGKAYKLRVVFYEPVGNAHIKLLWNAGRADSSALQIQQAVALAKGSDAVVVVAGITEGEFQDRGYLGLPGKQEALIEAVAATGKPVTVLLVGGSAIIMNKWKDKVKSIVQVWYPGEAGGEAVADMLFGKTNPGGKLPITFPVFEGQLPLVYNHKPTGRGDDYNNLSGEPLFPFGFGLSYTKFSYSDLQLSANAVTQSDALQVSCKVTNTGKVAGDEVVQLYLHDELASVARPVTALKAFQRVSLQPGESKIVQFTLNAEAFKMYNAQMQWVTEPGQFRIMIGASSKDIRLQEMVEVK